MTVLVVDVGTSSVRSAVVTADATAIHEACVPLLPDSPAPGLVEFDAVRMAEVALDAARTCLAAHDGPVDGVGITNQRGSTVVWDRKTGVPVGPALGWQDLRTVGRCLELGATGQRVAPNVAATKLEHLLDLADPERTRDLCFGTVDTWIAWNLSEGAVHVMDASNAAITGLMRGDASEWAPDALAAMRIPEHVLPTVVDSSGIVGAATALPGAPPIAALVGDQQASLAGQGCVHPGPAKITFGTGGMLDRVLGPSNPGFGRQRGPGGTFPIVCWRIGGVDTWGLEAIMLSAGTNVEWLRDDLGLITSSAESATLAAQCSDSGGVVFVPALLGLGTPQWDYGARGTMLGLTRGSGRAQIVRAVLEGVAHRGADLVEAAEADAGGPIEVLRVDGGMAANGIFVQALADSAQKPVEVAPVKEATTLGAGFLAGLAVGMWRELDDIATTWKPSARYEPQQELDREAWKRAVERAREWIPALSSLDF